MFNSGLNYPAASTATSTGILAALKKINFSNILNTAQKTLNVANQAIPLIYQVKPLINNAKTVFKIMGAVKDDNTYSKEKNSNKRTTNNQSNNYIKKEEYIKTNNTNQPQFFI